MGATKYRLLAIEAQWVGQSKGIGMDNEEAKRQYQDDLHARYEDFAQRLRNLLEELVRKEGIPLAHVEHRAKTADSLEQKIKRKVYTDPFSEIKDLAGVRFVTYYLEDVDHIASLIRKELKVDTSHSHDRAELLGVDEFGYRSVHLVVSLKQPRSELVEWKEFAGLSAEIQIRSVLQHAWASISHKLDYKQASQAPAEIRRQLFRLSALLELADDVFSKLRSDTRDVQRRYRREVSRGDLSIPLNVDSLSEFLRNKVDYKRWYGLGLNSGMGEQPDLLADPLRPGTTPYAEASILTSFFADLGIETLERLEEVLRAAEDLAPTTLPSFVAAVRTRGHDFAPVPMDIIVVAVSLFLLEELPVGYDWPFRPEIGGALEDARIALTGPDGPKPTEPSSKPKRGSRKRPQ